MSETSQDEYDRMHPTWLVDVYVPLGDVEAAYAAATRGEGADMEELEDTAAIQAYINEKDAALAEANARVEAAALALVGDSGLEPLEALRWKIESLRGELYAATSALTTRREAIDALQAKVEALEGERDEALEIVAIVAEVLDLDGLEGGIHAPCTSSEVDKCLNEWLESFDYLVMQWASMQDAFAAGGLASPLPPERLVALPSIRQALSTERQRAERYEKALEQIVDHNSLLWEEYVAKWGLAVSGVNSPTDRALAEMALRAALTPDTTPTEEKA